MFKTKILFKDTIKKTLHSIEKTERTITETKKSLCKPMLNKNKQLTKNVIYKAMVTTKNEKKLYLGITKV